MDGIRIGDVALFLTRMPDRKGLAFVFQDGSTLYPVAYIATQHEAAACRYWQAFLDAKYATILKEGVQEAPND